MSDDSLPHTLPALVADTARRFGPREAIVDGDLRLRWSDVDRLRRRSAAGFIAAGIAKGDRIAIWAPNLHEWILCAMGLQSIGAVLVPVNTRFKGDEAGDVLRRSRAKLLFTLDEFVGARFPELIAGESLPDLRSTVLLRRADGARPGWQDFLAAGESVSDAAVDRQAAEVKPEDIADIMFTSGTTGRPKGALLTHYQNIRGFRTMTSIAGVVPTDRILVIPPFFHSFGYKSGWLAGALTGATVLPAAVFDLDRLLPLIANEKITWIPGPPTIFYGLLEDPRRTQYDFSSLRMATVGASSIPVELVRRLYEVLKIRHVFSGFGITENTALGAHTLQSDPPEKVATTCGPPLPGMTLRIVDAEGRTLGPNEPGELLIRGFGVMKGYLDDPEQTAKAVDPEGWLHTGDIATLDADGYLRITDRLKDMYIVGGFNCYPAEIEGLLMKMPGVAQVAVIGVPDERMGEVGKAFVKMEAGASLTEAGVIAWAREHMSNFKAPRYVEFVDTYPLNATGKVLKTELRKRAVTSRSV